MRWARHGILGSREEIPSPRWTPKLIGKVALDEFFFATEFASATIVSLGHRHRLAQEIGDSLSLYASRGWLEDPASYHLAPPDLTDVELSLVDAPMGPYRHASWESLYEPHEGEPGRERWLSFERNRRAHAWVFEHPGPPRPWVVCVPGYRMGHHLVDFAGFRVRWLHAALGLNVAVPVMPLHGPRREGRRGGDGFLSGDFVDTVHAQAQAVWDTRRLMDWLRRGGAPKIAIYGVSLGGYTASLLASLEDRIDAVIIGIPATDFVSLLENHMPDFAVRLASRLGFPFDSLRSLLSVVSPLAIPPLVAHDRRFIYAATVDGLATPTQARELWRHWDRPRIAWYHGSHVSFLWEPKVKEIVEEGLRAAGMLEEDAFAIASSATPR